MIRHLRALFAIAVIAASLLGGSLATPAAAADAGLESDFVDRTNGARSGRGLGTLTTDGELTAIARRWSQRMANDNRLSHNPNLAREVTQDWEKLAENVGVGPGVEEIHNAFMNSAPHRANILDGALTHIGVGVVVDPSGQIWVTQVFMRLRGGGGGSATATTAAPPPPTATTTRPRATTTTAAPAPASAPAPTATPSPTTTRPPRSTTTTTPPGPTSPPTTSPPAPVAEPATTTTAAPAPAAAPTRRLVLVLDGLRALDRGR